MSRRPVEKKDGIKKNYSECIDGNNIVIKNLLNNVNILNKIKMNNEINEERLEIEDYSP